MVLGLRIITRAAGRLRTLIAINRKFATFHLHCRRKNLIVDLYASLPVKTRSSATA